MYKLIASLNQAWEHYQAGLINRKQLLAFNKIAFKEFDLELRGAK